MPWQVIFNEISAAEISQLPTEEQLALLSEFQVRAEDLEDLDESGAFGKIERDGIVLYRYRMADYRIYFQPAEHGVLVHRVLHRNTFQDFLFRSKLPMAEDEALGKSRVFWELIDEGRQARAAR